MTKRPQRGTPMSMLKEDTLNCAIKLLQEAEPNEHQAEDIGDESPRSEDPFVHPPDDDDDARQAVIMFHLSDDPIHAA